jgi:hypothetical protein
MFTLFLLQEPHTVKNCEECEEGRMSGQLTKFHPPRDPPLVCPACKVMVAGARSERRPPSVGISEWLSEANRKLHEHKSPSRHETL